MLVEERAATAEYFAAIEQVLVLSFANKNDQARDLFATKVADEPAYPRPAD